MQPGRVKDEARRGTVCTDGGGGVVGGGCVKLNSEKQDRKRCIIAARREMAARDGYDEAPRSDEITHWTKTETRSRAWY